MLGKTQSGRKLALHEETILIADLGSGPMSRKQVLPEYSDVSNLLKYILVYVYVCIYILAFQQFGYSQNQF